MAPIVATFAAKQRLRNEQEIGGHKGAQGTRSIALTHTHTLTQRHRDTEAQRHRGVETQRHRYTET